MRKAGIFLCVALFLTGPGLSQTQTLYAGTLGGVFKSVDGGANWNAVNNGLTNTSILSLAIDPGMSQTLYAGTQGGLFKSTGGGVSWSEVSSGLISTTVSSLAIDPATPATVYAGTNRRVFKSMDGGINWSAVNSAVSFVESLAIEPGTPQTIYAGASNGVFKSVDGGANWSAVITTGSAVVESNGPVSAVIRFDLLGSGVAGVGSAPSLSRAIAPVRRQGALDTGVAVRNTSSTPITVNLTLKGEDGNPIENGTTSEDLAPNGRMARFISELFPQAKTVNFSGTLCLETVTGTFAGVVIELEPGRAFTTLPMEAAKN